MRRMLSDLRGKEIIDSRDVIARLAELTELNEAATVLANDTLSEIAQLVALVFEDEQDDVERLDKVQKLEDNLWTNDEGTRYGVTDDYGEDEDEEFLELLSLTNEAEDKSDWKHGATLVREDHFEDYARELAEDIGAIDPKAGWPLNHIDWEEAAEELKNDYSEVTFGSYQYLIRDC